MNLKTRSLANGSWGSDLLLQLKKISFLSFNVQNPYKITIILLIFAKKCLTSGNAGRCGGRLTLYEPE